MNEMHISSATDHPAPPPSTTAGELSDSLKVVSAFLFQFGSDWMVDAVEDAIARLQRSPGRRHRVCVATLSGMIDDGRTRQEIAAALGAAPTTVARWCREFGLKVPTQPRGGHLKRRSPIEGME